MLTIVAVSIVHFHLASRAATNLSLVDLTKIHMMTLYESPCEYFLVLSCKYFLSALVLCIMVLISH